MDEICWRLRCRSANKPDPAVLMAVITPASASIPGVNDVGGRLLTSPPDRRSGAPETADPTVLRQRGAHRQQLAPGVARGLVGH